MNRYEIEKYITDKKQKVLRGIFFRSGENSSGQAKGPGSPALQGRWFQKFSVKPCRLMV